MQRQRRGCDSPICHRSKFTRRHPERPGIRTPANRTSSLWNRFVSLFIIPAIRCITFAVIFTLSVIISWSPQQFLNSSWWIPLEPSAVLLNVVSKLTAECVNGLDVIFVMAIVTVWSIFVVILTKMLFYIICILHKHIYFNFIFNGVHFV